MYLSNEGILMILLVGLIAGWLAGKIVRPVNRAGAVEYEIDENNGIKA